MTGFSGDVSSTDAAARIGLIMSTVRGLNDLAENSYNYAQQQLSVLGDASSELPLGVVDVDIGTNTPIAWGGGYAPPASPVEPAYEDTIESPAIPTFSAPSAAAGAIPEWSESAPLTPTAPVVPASGTQPTLVVVDPTVPETGINTGGAPEWDVDLSGTPTALVPASFSTLPTLGTLPTIEVSIPTMDVGLLAVDPADDFVEPTYVERVSTEVEAAIKSVLGGDLGLPSGYWDSLWAQAATDLGQQTVAEARLARNRGASSHWALPAEAVLVGSRRIQEEGSKKLTLARLEQAKQQAVYAREDFWQAVSKGIEYENQWINANDRVAQRALAASEQLYSIRVQVHNANISRYNSMLEAAKLDGTIDEMQAKLVLSQLDGELRSSAQEIERAGHTLNEYKTQWEGYKIDKTLTVTAMAEQIKFWNSQVDGDIRYQQLGLEGAKINMELVKTKIQAFQADVQAWLGSVDATTKTQGLVIESSKLDFQAFETKARVFASEVQAWAAASSTDVKYQDVVQGYSKLEIDLMAEQVKKVQGLAAATANLLQARTGASKFDADKQMHPHTIDRDRNAAELERSKITQAAQAASAKIDVAQAQWALGQDVSLKTNMAQLAYGYAQAAVAASDVGISSATNTSFNDSESASHNAERVW